MQVYIACLASYNAGVMHGEWIDMDGIDADEFHDRVADMLRRSPCPDAEEWAVHDYDDLPDLGEHPSVERLIEVAEAIAEHGEAMRVWLSVNHNNPDGFEDAYQGTADSWEGFAEQLLEDTGSLAEMPEHLRRYFDFAAYARDLRAEGWWTALGDDGQLHFFSV